MDKGYDHIMPYNDGWKKKTGSLGFRMSNDYLFRVLLQRDEETLKNLIAAFIGVSSDAIDDVTVVNPIMLGDTIDDKEIRLDVHAVVNHSEHMDLEMQTVQHEGFIERTVLYACRSFDLLHHGEDYVEIQGIWQIVFCDYSMFKDYKSFYSNYLLINEDEPKNIYTRKFRISTVDLTNIGLATERDKAAGLDKWARFFKAQTWEELMTLTNESKLIEKAVSSVWQLTEDEKIREQMRRREDNERYWNYMHNKVKRLEDESENAREQLVEARVELRDTKDELRDTKDELRDTKVQLEQQLVEKDEEIERLKQELEKYKH